MNALKKLIYILLIIVVAVQIYLISQEKETESSSEKKRVTVSSFALYDVATHLSAGSVDVINVLPLGVDPHSFEPTPKLMAEIEKSDFLFFSGAGLEPWIEGISFKNRAIDVSRYVKLLEFAEGEHHEHEHHNEHKEHGEHEEHHDHEEHDHEEHHEHKHEQCDHSGIDPHYWLDFENMQKVVTLIKEELIALVPQNKELYEQNAAHYIEMLQKLDKEYTSAFESCVNDLVIVNHNAIGYIAHKYGFRVESLSGFSPDSQPNPKDLTRLFSQIQKEGVKTLFFESFVSNKTINAVAKDANVSLEVLQPLGNITAKEAEQKLSYEQIMHQNLQKLSKALECR